MSEHETPKNGHPGDSRFERLRWPFERVAWVAQRRLIWPTQDRLALLGRPTRALAAAAAVVLAVAATAVGIGVAGSGGSPDAPASQLAAEPAPTPSPAPAEPVAEAEEQTTLEGASPVFEPARKQREKRESEAGGANRSEQPAAGGSAATDTISSSPANADSASASAAQASSAGGADEDGPPAGKKALAVARDFADAFVVYETGGEKAEVRTALAGSATKALTRSLLRRPPRLPANVEVPRAKVVNVVAGPSRGGVYPVSVSLLRVGLTSELRLEMEKLEGKRWRVTNVLG